MMKLDYTYSKIIGTHSRTGGRELTRLRPVHKEMIALHLRGKSIKSIAKQLHYSDSYVSIIISSKAAKPYLDAYHNVVDLDIKALASKAVEVLGGALNDGTISEQTTAAKEVLKLNDRYPKEDNSQPDGQNAADIVREVINLARDAMDVRRVERHPQAQIIDVDSSLIEGES